MGIGVHEQIGLNSIRLKPGEEWDNLPKRPKPWRGLALILPVSGSGDWTGGGASEHFQSGDLLIADANSTFRVRADDLPNGLAFSRLSLPVDFLFPLLAVDQVRPLDLYLKKLTLPKRHPGDSPIAQRCHLLAAEIQNQPALERRCRELVVAGVALEMILEQQAPSREGPIRTRRQMEQALGRLTVAEVSTASVGQLARRFGCGRRQLNRLFQRHLGVSVAELRMEMRLIHAAALLRNPEAKVATVAEDCGFNHLGLFNTLFKRRFGASPTRFRREFLADNPPGEEPRTDDSALNCWMRARGLCPWFQRPC